MPEFRLNTADGLMRDRHTSARMARRAALDAAEATCERVEVQTLVNVPDPHNAGEVLPGRERWRVVYIVDAGGRIIPPSQAQVAGPGGGHREGGRCWCANCRAARR